MEENNKKSNQGGSASDNAQGEVDVILAAIEYPVSRDDLVEAARDSDVHPDVVVFFERLPSEDFYSSDEVKDASERNEGDKSQT